MNNHKEVEGAKDQLELKQAVKDIKKDTDKARELRVIEQ